jgi:hypothetical protein
MDLSAFGALLVWRPKRQTGGEARTFFASRLRLAYLGFLMLAFVTGNAAALLLAGDRSADWKNVVEQLPPIYAGPGTKLVHYFTVKNYSGEVQRISEVTHSCLCLKAALDRTELGPGDETQLRLEADLSGRRGAETFTAFLHLETGKGWTYSVQTEVIQRVGFDPPSLAFGFLNPSEKKSQTVDVLMRTGPDDPMPQVLSVVPRCENLAVAWSESPSGGGSDSARVLCRLAVTLTADVAPGTSSATVALHYQLGGQEHEAILPITWTVRSNYEITPPRVFFITSRSHDKLERKVLLRRLDQRPFAIRGVRTTDPLIHCTTTLNAASETQELAVEIDLGRKQSTVTGDVIVETNDASQPRVEVQVTVINRQNVP